MNDEYYAKVAEHIETILESFSYMLLSFFEYLQFVFF